MAHSRLRTLARVVLWTLPVLLGTAALAGGVGVLWLQSRPGNAWLLSAVLPLVQPDAGEITVGELSTDLFGRLELADVKLIGPDGEVVLAVEQAEAFYAGQSLLGRTLPIRWLRLEGLHLDVADPGVFGRMWPGDPSGPSTPWGGLPLELLAEQVEVEGSVRWGEWTVSDVALRGKVVGRGRRIMWTELEGAGRTTAGPLALSGAGSWEPGLLVLSNQHLRVGGDAYSEVRISGALNDDALAFELSPVHFDAGALTPLLPVMAKVPLSSPVDLSGSLRGTLSRPELVAQLVTAGGALDVSGWVSPAERTWDAEVTTVRFDTEPVLRDLPAAVVEGRVRARGRGWSWPEELDAESELDVQITSGREVLVLTGPATLSRGVVTLSGTRAGLGWGGATASGTVDILARRADLQVARSAVSLSRFGYGGGAQFAGGVAVSWGDRVTADVVGQLEARDVAAVGATVGRASGPVSLRWDGRRLHGETQLDLAEVAWRDRRAATGTALLRFGEEVDVELALLEPDRAIARVDLAYGLDSRVLNVRVANVELAPGLAAIAEGPQRLRLVEGGIADADLRVRVGAALLTARGGLGERGQDTLVVEVSDLELTTLGSAVPGAFVGWEGQVDARAGLVGNLGALRLEGELRGAGLKIPGQLADAALEASFESVGRQLRVTGELSGSEARALLDAALPLTLSASGPRLHTAEPMSVQLLVPPVNSAQVGQLLGGRTLPEARLSAELELSGTLEAPAGSLVASVDLPVRPGGPTVRTWLDAQLADGAASARVVLNQDFQSRAEAMLAVSLDTPAVLAWLQGKQPLPEAKALLSGFGGSVLLKGLPLATLRRFVEIEGDFDGNIAGAFALLGSPFAPRLHGGVNFANARVGGLTVEPARLELEPLPGGYKVGADFGFQLVERKEGALGTCARKEGDPAGSVTVNGYIPLDDTYAVDRPGLTLQVGGGGLPLAALEAFLPDLVDTRGCLVVNGAITGSLGKPDIAVGIALDGGQTSVAPLGVRFSDVEVRGRFQEEVLVLDELSGVTQSSYLGDEVFDFDGSTGRFEMKGQLALDDWLPKSLDATATLDGVWLTATTDRRAQVSGDLQLHGEGSVLDVSGDIVVDDAFIRLRERFFSAGAGLAIHPDLHVVRPGGEAAEVERGERSAFGLRVRPNVNVDLARHLRVEVAMPLQSAYGDLARSLTTVQVKAEADGQLLLSTSGDDYRLTGEVVTEGGRVKVLGRSFELEQGSLAFTGFDYRLPLLNLHAVYKTADHGDITVDVGGVPGDPQLSFQSVNTGDGDVLSQDQIVEVLVLGSTVANLASSGGAEAELGGQALSLVTAMLRNELSEGLATTFRIESFEIDQDATRVGLALGKDVFLTTEYNFSVAAGEGNRLGVAVEVALPYRWYLELSTGDQGVSAVSSYRKWRF